MSHAYGGGMTPSDTLRANYRPIGGVLCLDFANTVDWHDSERRVELLADAECLAAWARIVGAGDVDPAAADLHRACRLRDAVWAVFRAKAKAETVPGDAVAEINRALERAPAGRRLRVSGDEVVWADGTDGGTDALPRRHRALGGRAADRSGPARTRPDVRRRGLRLAVPGREPGRAAALVLDAGLRQPREGAGALPAKGQVNTSIDLY